MGPLRCTLHVSLQTCAMRFLHGSDVFVRSAVQAWVEVTFKGTDTTRPCCTYDGYTYADQNCSARTINTQMPANRAGHSAVSTGSESILCGGYTSKTSTSVTFSGNGNDIDCWWFVPLPFAHFSPLKIKSGSAKPAARFAHASAEDEHTGHMLVFGGMTKGNKALDDCWYLLLSESVSTTSEQQWVSCNPTSSLMKPMARYGAGAVFHDDSHSFYIYGGFARSGLSVIPMSDMWVLRDFVNVSSSKWEEINAVSDKPTPRGMHAMWLMGYNIFIHGGEGPGGVGIASVRSDTWSYDIFTQVWKQYGSSDASPLASSQSVGLVGSQAVSFGGLGKDSTPINKCVFFDAKIGWTSVTPAGAVLCMCPSLCTTHTHTHTHTQCG